MKVRAIVFEAPGRVVLKEIELPTPEPDDLVVETEVSGVSVGTERWALTGKRAEIPFPNVPGYMGIGRIVQVGNRATELGFQHGQRVNYFRSRLPEPYAKSWMGSHLSAAVVNVSPLRAQPDSTALDVHCCEILPGGLDPLDASLCGLCSVALRGIEMAGVPGGTRVLVSGAGVIGQCAAQVCRLKGAQVAVSDVVEARLETARRTGADWVLNAGNDRFVDECRRIAPQGFDIIIDTSSTPAVVNRIIPLLKLRGKFVFQGWYPPPSEIDLNAFHLRLPTCYCPCAHSGPAVSMAMRWVRDKRLDTRSLITHRAKPEDAPEIYRMIETGSNEFLGVVFDWRHP